jgi:cation:H+ antiporter
VGPSSLLLFVAYIAGARAVYRHATRSATLPASPAAAEAGAAPQSLRRSVVRFAVSAVVVLAAAPVLAWAAKGVAEVTGLGNTFVGTWLVGLATSLPELAASLAAVRMGAFDLAVGNLFGSNAFNMALLLPVDLAQPGALLSAVDPTHALSGLFAVVLMSLGLAAIVYRAKRRFSMLEPDSLLMLVAYGLAMWLLYVQSAR